MFKTIICNELRKTTYPINILEEFLLILPLIKFSDLLNFYERINGNIGTNQDYVYRQLKFLYDNIPDDYAKKYVDTIKEYYLKHHI